MEILHYSEQNADGLLNWLQDIASVRDNEQKLFKAFWV